MKKTLALCLVIINLLLLLSLGAQGAAKQPAAKQPAKPALIPTNIPKSLPILKQDPTYTTVKLWYAMTGSGEQTLGDLLAWFNGTIGREKKIYVKCVYLGEYDESALKIRATLGYESDPKNMPDLVQLNSAGMYAAYYKDTYINEEPKDLPERLVILEDMLLKENKLSIKTILNPNAAAACSFKGKLVGLPFGSEMMALHYNADAFKAAGLDPANPPKTMEEYAKAAAKLLIKDKTGAVKRYGSAGRLDVRLLSTWIPRMQLASGGQFNKEEGRLGIPYEYLLTKRDTLKRVLIEWKKLLDTGANDNTLFTNSGICQQFEDGGAAMYMASTVNMEGTLSRVAAEKDKTKKFDARLARLPKLTAADAVGQTIGGYGLYLFNNGDKARNKAAFEFIKFLVSVDASAYFTAKSGYFPTNTDAMNTKYVQNALKKNKHRKLSFDLLAEAARNTKLQEPFIPGGVAYNNTIGEQAVEMANGQSVDTTVNNIARKAHRCLTIFFTACK